MVKLTRLRTVRERVPYTQQELADLAGINRVTLVRIEKGQEWGRFEFGSTIVLVASPGWLALQAQEPGRPLVLGSRIGTSSPASAA